MSSEKFYILDRMLSLYTILTFEPRNDCRGPLSYGKILIQRDEETCLPHYVYCKLPKDIANKSKY